MGVSGRVQNIPVRSDLAGPRYSYLQPADFQRLAVASSIPLAVGKREWDRYTVRDFIGSGAIH
jgi:hypothetical protein